MAITDNNLAAVLERLTPQERAALQHCAQPPHDGRASEDTAALAAEALRKIKARLKRKARRRRDKSRAFKWLN